VKTCENKLSKTFKAVKVNVLMGKGLNGLDDEVYINIIYEHTEVIEDTDNVHIEYGKTATASELIELFSQTHHDPDKFAILSLMLRGFDPERKLQNFEKKVYDLYINGFIEYINQESPTHILDTGLTASYYVEFYNMIMTSTTMGKNLTKLVSIYNECG